MHWEMRNIFHFLNVVQVKHHVRADVRPKHRKLHGSRIPAWKIWSTDLLLWSRRSPWALDSCNLSPSGMHEFRGAPRSVGCSVHMTRPAGRTSPAPTPMPSLEAPCDPPHGPRQQRRAFLHPAQSDLQTLKTLRLQSKARHGHDKLLHAETKTLHVTDRDIQKLSGCKSWVHTPPQLYKQTRHLKHYKHSFITTGNKKWPKNWYGKILILKESKWYSEYNFFITVSVICFCFVFHHFQVFDPE